MKNVTFNLDDKFCDGDVLKESWENTPMPDQLLTFFSSLFNIHRSLLLKFEMISMMEDDDASIAENNHAEEDLSSDLFTSFHESSEINIINCIASFK